MPTQKSRAEYMAARRAAAKADTALVPLDPPTIIAEEVGDRANGLPRSNYYGDWVPTIQRMSSHQADAILSHPAVKTSSRSK